MTRQNEQVQHAGQGWTSLLSMSYCHSLCLQNQFDSMTVDRTDCSTQQQSALGSCEPSKRESICPAACTGKQHMSCIADFKGAVPWGFKQSGEAHHAASIDRREYGSKANRGSGLEITPDVGMGAEQQERCQQEDRSQARLWKCQRPICVQDFNPSFP